MRLIKSLIFLLAFHIFIPGSAYASGDIFPESLSNFERISITKGSEAVKSVKMLHRGSKIQLEDAVVAKYRDGSSEKIIIWASKSSSEKEAAKLIRGMNKKMPSSNMYRNFTSIKIDGCKLYSVDGMGMENYYFVKEEWNYWLAVKADNSKLILSKFMNNLSDCKSSE